MSCRTVLPAAVLFLAAGLAGSALAACPEDLSKLQASLQEPPGQEGERVALAEVERTELQAMLEAAQQFYQSGRLDDCAAVVDYAQEILSSARSPELAPVTALLDKEVTNAQGEELGQVEEVIMDPVSGKIAYLAIRFGGVLGMGEAIVPVPWGVVRGSTEEEKLLLAVTLDQLETAPRLDRERWPETVNRSWGESIHSFYGVEPYWSNRSSLARGRVTAGLKPAAEKQAEPAKKPEAQAEQPAGTSGTSAQGKTETQTAASAPMPAPAAQAEAEALASKVAQLSREVAILRQEVQQGAGGGGAATGGESMARLSTSVEQMREQLGTLQQKLEGLERQGQGGTPGAAGHAGAAVQNTQTARKPDGQPAQQGQAAGACAGRIAAAEQRLSTGSGQQPSQDQRTSLQNQLQIAKALAEGGKEDECRVMVEKVEEQFKTQ